MDNKEERNFLDALAGRPVEQLGLEPDVQIGRAHV